MNNNHNIRISHINVRSLFTGFGEFVQIVLQEKFHIIAVTETWLTPHISTNLISIPGYNFFRQDRTLGRGGGVGVYVSTALEVEIVDFIDITPNVNLEHIWLKFKIKNKIYALGNIYRPPSGNLNIAINQLDETLSLLVPMVDDVFCVGDMNVNLLHLNNPLLNALESYNFVQLINEPTRITGTSSSLLDPIFVTNPNIIVNVGLLNADLISDHKLVFCDLSLKTSKSISKLITYRDFKNFNYNIFLQDLHTLPWHVFIETADIDKKIQILNEFILKIFDIHAPLRQVKVTKARAPWLTDTLKIMMRHRDDAKSKYKISKSQTDWENYKLLRNQTLAALRAEKKAYINFINSKNDPKTMWNTLKNFNVKPSTCHEIPLNIANPDAINDYFISTRQTNNNCHEAIQFYNNNFYNENKFSFHLSTIQEVTDAINQIKSNAYGIDNISIRMIKYCAPFINKYITHLINCCIEKGYFPTNWKCALITPMPKVSNPQLLSDLRPISILPALSKILEKIIYAQIYNYTNENHILNKYQSGFRAGHSTASALCQVTDDLIRAMDENMATILILLDYSKAFDTINHELMAAKFKYYGFDQIAIKFINSYLCNRRQIVRIGNTLSSSAFLTTGVPQGSILGPLFFVIYTTDILNQINIPHHAYADDTQIYYSFKAGNTITVQNKINENLHNINKLSIRHNLTLNPKKCMVLYFGRKNTLNKLGMIKIVINNETLPIVESAKSLGVIYDSNLKFSLQVNKVVQKCYLNLKLLYSNRHILNFNVRKNLCQSLVLSHINYCNFVYGPCLDTVDKNRLQKVQNSCCRLIFGLRKYDSGISAKIKLLSWLNISNHIKFQLLVFVHRVVTSSTPNYINEKFIRRNQQHAINIRSNLLYAIPKFKTSFFKKSFSYNAIKLYNSLPQTLKSLGVFAFKKKLKLLLLQEK